MHPPFTLKMWKRVLDRLDLVPGDETPPGGEGDPGNAGMELIESGTISSPVEYLDIDLPSGYSLYVMYFSDILFAGDDALYVAVSLNDGISFICDPDNGDSYNDARAVNPATGAFSSASQDSLAQITGTLTAITLGNVQMLIYPGAASVNCVLQSQQLLPAGGGGFPFRRASINATATIPSALARVTTLRFQPYGNGDANPPTDGNTIVSGSYFLYGVPTP